jgi:hypothetical protein
LSPVWASLLDSLNLENLEGKALLLDHFRELGAITIDGAVMNSGEVVRGCVEDRERMRESGRYGVN